MNRYLISILLLTVMLSSAVNVFAAESHSPIGSFAQEMVKEAKDNAGYDKKVIALIEFESLSKLTKEENLGSILTSYFITEFVSSKEFTVVERAHLDKVLEELNFSKTGMVDSRSAHQLGLMISADYIICGTVSEMGEYFDINVRLINVESSSIVAARVFELPQTEYYGKSGKPVNGRDVKAMIQNNIDAIYSALYYYGVKNREGFKIIYPKKLDDLVPEFLYKIPDPVKGKWIYDRKHGRVKNSAYPKLSPSVEFPRVQPALDMAKKNVILSRMRNINVAIQMYMAEMGEYPPDLKTLHKQGLLHEMPDPVEGEWVYDPKKGSISHSVIGGMNYN